ncbi:hypothetical protein [Segetibacter koreensis]|uniref:hypothetical protein n=1 Tax=Segetibacter koreensis TaxID=398037 RepID=UPI00036A5665|nr:hypothetical protein [Segetibacter koreensis]
MFNTPILFIIFNRPEATKKVFESIRIIKPFKLYIAADGPRLGNLNDKEKCVQAREIVGQVDWKCEVKKLYRNENLGCFKAVSGALNWFFQEEEMGIILEDDCLPNTDFYFFCQQMLDRFKDEDKIISISGSNLGHNLNNGNSYTFSKFMNMWGWATWRRAAISIDYNLENWQRKKFKIFFLYSKLKNFFFDFDIKWYQYWKHKFDYIVYNEKITWDWQWTFHQLENRQLSIVPAVNLVTNIGFNADATHTYEQSNPASNIPSKDLKFPLVHPTTIRFNLDYEEKFVKWVWCYHKRMSILKYLITRIKSLVK